MKKFHFGAKVTRKIVKLLCLAPNLLGKAKRKGSKVYIPSITETR